MMELSWCAMIGVLLILSDSMAENVTVTPNERTGCPGERVEFSCTTTNSSLLRWTSDIHIGANGEDLTFITAFGNGTRLPTTVTVGSTYAILVQKHCQNDSCVLVSSITVYITNDTIALLSCHSDKKTVNITITVNCTCIDQCTSITAILMHSNTTEMYTHATFNTTGTTDTPILIVNSGLSLKTHTCLMWILWSMVVTLLVVYTVFV